jgi:hypothetical protein
MARYSAAYSVATQRVWQDEEKHVLMNKILYTALTLVKKEMRFYHTSCRTKCNRWFTTVEIYRIS